MLSCMLRPPCAGCPAAPKPSVLQQSLDRDFGAWPDPQHVPPASGQAQGCRGAKLLYLFVAAQVPSSVRGLLISLKEALICVGVLSGYSLGYLTAEQAGRSLLSHCPTLVYRYILSQQTRAYCIITAFAEHDSRFPVWRWAAGAPSSALRCSQPLALARAWCESGPRVSAASCWKRSCALCRGAGPLPPSAPV